MVGEMTITLKDVALLLGLLVEGEPVLGVTYTSCSKVCERFLSKVSESGYMSGGMVKLSWLKEFFCVCPEDASTGDVECHTRAHLLYLMGSTIFSTTGNNVGRFLKGWEVLLGHACICTEHLGGPLLNLKIP